MELANLLLEKKKEIIKEWFDLAVQAYPPDTARFLKGKTNRFANPVGYNFNVAMEAVLGHLLDDKYEGDIIGSLEGLVKIKAVQDFSASQAVRFIFLLKQVLRKHMGDRLESILELEDKVDKLALVCFDLYMRNREKVHDLKSAELRRMHYRLLEQANIVSRKEDPIGGNGSSK